MLIAIVVSLLSVSHASPGANWLTITDSVRDAKSPGTESFNRRAPTSFFPAGAWPLSRPLSGGGENPVPAFDRIRGARCRSHVDGRRTDQLAEPLLLENVGAPPRGAPTGEHRRHHVGRHPGKVQHYRGPELDVGLDS